MNKNLFDTLPTSLPAELVENLFQTENVRIERIVSTGQSSPPDFWYDQDESEWVVLLRGSATLEFEGDSEMKQMLPGDYIFITEHQKHRVHSTSTTETTVWLTVFIKPS
ncbi:MAG: cupin domain-containing protein [Planctomycetaceae bacterium]|nr:cupin domain-containing protein [Planctomycetaceae bacterium]